MFGQVSLLGVRLATVRTDVSLQMFGLLVLGYVVQQRGFVMEALVAGVTLVRLVSLVAPRVGLQVGQLGEGLGATCRIFGRVLFFYFLKKYLPAWRHLYGLSPV